MRALGQECLDHFIVFGQRHLNYLCSVFIDYYHRLRPHQGKENELLVPASAKKGRTRRKQPAVRSLGTILLTQFRCEKRLGGLLKHYYRKAA
jgi:putative transposase